MTEKRLRGPVLSFSARPTDADAPGVDYLDDAVVILRGERIHEVLPAQRFQRDGGDLRGCEDLSAGLIIPGLIDAHIHCSQMSVIASYGSQLLEWLEKYAFPAELAFASAEHAQLQAEAFLDRLAEHGTTTSLTFTTVHPAATQALFAAAARRNVRLIAGKVLMNRNAPDGLLDRGDGIDESVALIERWHGRHRLAYAVTPRFALTCTPAQLSRAGELLARYPGVYLHSHLAEHPDETRSMLELFPEARDCVDVYDRFGLVGERSVFAHGIHLSDAELERLHDAGSTIAFCPSSNLFLGSGLLDLERLDRFGVHYGVATDVGAGTSFSMLTTLGDGYRVAQLTGQSWHPLRALYTATLGNARALGWDDRIGRVAAGYEADLTVLQPVPGTVLADRIGSARTLAERLFAYLVLGQQAVARCYIGGALAYVREPAVP
ncbi:MAG: guanine deaminase [Pseudomonadales bacterium]